MDIYKFRDNSRKVFKFNIQDPGKSTGAENKINVMDISVAVLPFVDNRDINTMTHATSIPLAILAAKTLSVDAEKYGIFKKTVMPPASFYDGKSLTIDADTFGAITKTCGTKGVIWGVIDTMDFKMEPSNEFGKFNLILTITGNIKMMLKPGITAYYHDFSKTQTYSFANSGMFSYSYDDFDKLSPQILMFMDWVMKSELDNMVANSADILSGKNIDSAELPADVITYPVYKVYSMKEVNNITTGFSMLDELVGIACGLIAGYAVSYGSDDLSTGFFALFVVYPIGMVSGMLITHAITNQMMEDALDKTAFYAQAPPFPDIKNRKDIVFSTTLFTSKF
jgi:hypothetical protein